MINKQAFEQWWNLPQFEVLRPTVNEIWQYFHREYPQEAIRQQLLTDLIECSSGQNLPPTNQTNRIRAWVMADHLERLWDATLIDDRRTGDRRKHG